MVKLAGTEDIALYFIFLRTLHAWVPNKLHACQEMEGAQFHLNWNSSRQPFPTYHNPKFWDIINITQTQSLNGKQLAVQGLTIIIVVIIVVIRLLCLGGGCLWFSWCCFCRGLFWRYGLLFRLLCGFYNSIQDSDWVDQKLSESLNLAAEGYQDYHRLLKAGNKHSQYFLQTYLLTT